MRIIINNNREEILWDAKIQSDSEATLCREFVGGQIINYYAIATENLSREIRRAMGDNGFGIPAEVMPS